MRWQIAVRRATAPTARRRGGGADAGRRGLLHPADAGFRAAWHTAPWWQPTRRRAASHRSVRPQRRCAALARVFAPGRAAKRWADRRRLCPHACAPRLGLWIEASWTVGNLISSWHRLCLRPVAGAPRLLYRCIAGTIRGASASTAGAFVGITCCTSPVNPLRGCVNDVTRMRDLLAARSSPVPGIARCRCWPMGRLPARVSSTPGAATWARPGRAMWPVPVTAATAPGGGAAWSSGTSS